MINWVDPAEHHRNLPKKWMSGNVLIFNESDDLLLLKPSYRDHWIIPDGSCDMNETPLQTAMREADEETGLHVRIGRLLCVDYRPPEGVVTEGFHFIFEAANWAGELAVDGGEIIDARFMPKQDALDHLSTALAKRVDFALKARETGQVFYLEDGENPFGN